MPQRTPILRIRPRADGMTHVQFDHKVDVRPQVVLYTEQAHEFVSLHPEDWIGTLISGMPRRNQELTS